MRIILIAILSLILLNIPLFGQSEKPPALFNPRVSLGPISNVQKQIIYNHLQTQISKQFELISQRKFEEAQNPVFEELDY